MEKDIRSCSYVEPNNDNIKYLDIHYREFRWEGDTLVDSSDDVISSMRDNDGQIPDEFFSKRNKQLQYFYIGQEKTKNNFIY